MFEIIGKLACAVLIACVVWDIASTLVRDAWHSQAKAEDWSFLDGVEAWRASMHQRAGSVRKHKGELCAVLAVALLGIATGQLLSAIGAMTVLVGLKVAHERLKPNKKPQAVQTGAQPIAD